MDSSIWERLEVESAPSLARRPHFETQQMSTSSFQLQIDRSPSLLRVRSSDWYHNEVHDLYFHASKLVFVSKHFRLHNSGRTNWLCHHFGSDFGSISLSEMWIFIPAMYLHRNHIAKNRIFRSDSFHRRGPSWSPCLPILKRIEAILGGDSPYLTIPL